MTVAAIGIAGGSALLAPVAVPTLHGIAGIAVVGLGFYVSGSAVINTTGFLNEKAVEIFSDGASAAGWINGAIFSKPKPRVRAKEVPFRSKECQGRGE
jgi:hypothetical protein